MTTPDDAEPRELPSFARSAPIERRYLPRPTPPKFRHDSKATPQQRANLEKAWEAARVQRERAKEEKIERLTIEKVWDNLREEMLPMYPVVAQVLKRQMREGPQSMRYRAALDWRDMIIGRPNTARQDEVDDGDIVIISPIMARLQEGMEKPDAD